MRRGGGFTLVEVLLATAILSFGIVVLLTAASRCLAVMKSAYRYQAVQWTLGQGEVDFPMTATNDIMDLACGPERYDNGCTYERAVDEDEDEDGLYLVRIRVSWGDRQRERVEEVVRYVYQKDD